MQKTAATVREPYQVRHYQPDFDRLRQAVLLQGEPDRVPLAEIHVDESIKKAFLGKEVVDERADVDFWAAAGYDYVPVPVGIRRLFDDETGHSVAGGIFHAAREVREYEVPASGQTTTREWAAGKGIITSVDEFETFPWPEASELDYDIVRRYMQHAPEGMKIIPIVGHVMAMTWQLMGFEQFCLSLKDEPELGKRLFEKLADYQRMTVEALIDLPDVGGFWVGDDIAYTESFLISPSYLRQYLFPIYAEIGKMCRAREKLYIYHSDGKLYDVLEDIVACGFHALHPVEPKAMNIEDLQDLVGDRLCLIGNIDLGYTLTRGTTTEVAEEVRERIRVLAPGGGYCLGSSNSVTDYVPIQNYHAMIGAHRRYGAYPIRL